MFENETARCRHWLVFCPMLAMAAVVVFCEPILAQQPQATEKRLVGAAEPADQRHASRTFSIQFEDVEHIRVALAAMFDGDISLQIDQRANALKVTAAEDTLADIAAVVGELDAADAPTRIALLYLKNIDPRMAHRILVASTEGTSVQPRTIAVDVERGLLIVRGEPEHVEFAKRLVRNLDAHSNALLKSADTKAKKPQAGIKLSSLQRELVAAVERVSAAVVRLESGGLNGSGVVIDASGLILTHGHHTLGVRDSVTVHFRDGTAANAVIEAIYRGNGSDYSIARITELGHWPAASLEQSETLSRNGVCFHLGWPGSLVVAGSPEEQQPMLLMRLGEIVDFDAAFVRASCKIVPGDSGAPLFTLEGKVIGIATSSSCQENAVGIWTRVSVVTRGPLSAIATPAASKLEFSATNDASVLSKSFHETAQAALSSTVEVVLDGEPVALGIVVEPKMILTKRSEVSSLDGKALGELQCRLPDGSLAQASIVGENHDYDLALLRCDGCRFEPVVFGDVDARAGNVVGSVQPGSRPVPGVISRSGSFGIRPMQGNLGLPTAERGGQLIVEKTGPIKDVPFDLAEMTLVGEAIRFGDVITHVESKAVLNRASYVAIAKDCVGGDRLRLTVSRDGRVFDVNVPTSAAHPPVALRFPVSYRFTGFPEIISHDAVVDRTHCGGPIIDIEGKVIGMNIARTDRHQMAAVPGFALLKLIDRMLDT